MKKEKKDKLEKKLNVLLTIVLVVCAIVCLSLCLQTIRGKQASIFGFRIYHILTGSMEPTIPTGTNVIVHTTDPYKLEEGDIITFISRDSAIYGNANTHRIISIETDENGSRYFVTKGDANNTADSVYVYPQDIVGKVVFHMKSRFFANFSGFVRTAPGFVSVVVLPLCLVCVWVTKDFKRGVEELQEENERNERQQQGSSDGDPGNSKES